MIRIIKDGSRLILEYEVSNNDLHWVDRKLEKYGKVTIRRVFTFEARDVLPRQNDDSYNRERLSIDHDSRQFLLGNLESDYYRIRKEILRLNYDLLIFKDVELTHKLFIAHRDISIFSKIDCLVDESIVVGGDKPNSIPEEEFQYFLKEFPTSTELTHYAGARISRVLEEYLGTMTDAQKKLSDYFKKKNRRIIGVKESTGTVSTKAKVFITNEIEKFEYIHAQLEEMLAEWEAYNEYDWQNIIVELLCLIFPKYIAVLKELEVKDFYSNSPDVVKRKIDFTLVDVNGSIDIVEIKQPFEKCILSQGVYRDNYTPKKELSGAIMQAEKYIFHLMKWGAEGEKKILERRKNELPEGFQIRITNPKALIILGRYDKFTPEQKFDFEIIRRKYANMIDIITYDDLLQRLQNIIAMLSKKIN